MRKQTRDIVQHCAIHCFTIYPAKRDRSHGEGHVMWKMGTLVQPDFKHERRVLF